jgi:hypothetical protein
VGKMRSYWPLNVGRAYNYHCNLNEYNWDVRKIYQLGEKQPLLRHIMNYADEIEYLNHDKHTHRSVFYKD